MVCYSAWQVVLFAPKSLVTIETVMQKSSAKSHLDVRRVVRVSAFPILTFLVLAAYVLLYRLLGLPSPDELVRLSESYYARYGYWVVLVGALIEGVILVNWYFPGSYIILLGVVFSKNGTLNPFLVVGLATLAFFLAYLFEYAIGRYGWYAVLLRFGLKSPLQRMRERILQHGPRLIFVTYIHPNIGALAATSCGILQIPIVTFLVYSALALVFWNTLWGVLTYFAGSVILELTNNALLIPIVLLWVLFSIARALRSPASESGGPRWGD